MAEVGLPVCENFLPERYVISGMIKVKARNNESVQQMLRRFKKLCEKEGLTKDVKRNSYYEKPSERRRRQKRQSISRIARMRRS